MIDAYRRSGKMNGRCLCGAVRIQVEGPHVGAVGICHCAMCQRWSGAVFGIFTADSSAVTVTGDVVQYTSSDFSERAFCPSCGSHLWMRDTSQADADYELMPGLFPDARDFPLISEIYIDRAPAYAALSGNHKRATRADYEANNPHIEGDLP